MASGKLFALLLGLLTLAALAVRLRGIDHGLPVALEQDCKIPRQVELLREGGEAWRTDREFRWYPLLVAELASLWPEAQPAPAGATLDEHLRAAARPHVQARWTVALLAVLAIPLTFLLAQRFLERPWALVSAAFVATSLLEQSFSQQSRPHAVAATTFLAAVLAAVRLRESGRAREFAAAGIAAALALGTLHSGAMVFPALAVAWLGLRTRVFDVRLAWIALPLAAALACFYPFLFTGSSESGKASLAFDAEHWKLVVGGHEVFLAQFLGRGVRPLAWSLWSYEPAMLVLASLAALFAFFGGRKSAPERRPALRVVLAFVLPYAAIVLLYERTYERFALPLVPYLAIASAFALRELARLVRKPALIGAIVALALAVPAWAAWRLSTIRSAPHTTELAARWLVEHARPEQDVALFPQLDLPLCRERAGFASWMGPIEQQFAWPWSRYQSRLPGGAGPEPRWKLRWWRPKFEPMVRDPAGYIGEQGGELVVAEVYAQNRVHPGGTKVREELQRSARLLARFSPDADANSCEHPLGYQEETSVPPPHFFARVLGARGTGPVIEIYSLAGR